VLPRQNQHLSAVAGALPTGTGMPAPDGETRL
jgi:hypothetical protein